MSEGNGANLSGAYAHKGGTGGSPVHAKEKHKPCKAAVVLTIFEVFDKMAASRDEMS